MRFPRPLPAILLLLAVAPSLAAAQEPTAAEVLFTVNNLWLLVATFLVFLMHLGFTALESGLTQSKNTVNILFKNMSIIAIGILTYAAIGFSLMYPDEFFLPGLLGWAGPGVGTDAEGLTAAYDPGFTYWADFIFQAMFAATAATIVSGAVAERIKLESFLIFSALYVAFVYPILGSWQWGGGWLDQLGFYDFAGSTVVHSVGGWAALAGVMVLGPRLGKYVNGGIRPILGHNLPLAVVGMFLLWLGWFGFNGGSVLSADPGEVSFVFVTTAIAAAAGIVGAMATTWTVHKHPDVTMVLNGALAGLVGITAGADVVSVLSAVIIGLVAGVVVVFSVMMLDRWKLDDPVGAISVHLTCGIWGTLAVGIFSPDFGIVTQLIGVVGYGVVAFLSALALFVGIKATIGLRVSEDDERRGLDLSEHNMEAYSEFQIFNSRS
ncbi:MAG: ammonium transporter [Gemmatimonadales bacterium]|nr:MAG: ammonium transporter [Gemmatimonadales bacterium]